MYHTVPQPLANIARTRQRSLLVLSFFDCTLEPRWAKDALKRINACITQRFLPANTQPSLGTNLQ